MSSHNYFQAFINWFKGLQLEQYYHALIALIIKITVALLLFYIGRFFIKLILRLYKRFNTKGKLNFSKSIFTFTYSLGKMILYLILFLFILNVIGVPSTSFIAILGTAGIGLSLALKDNLSDLASGFTLLVIRPFEIGDHVIIKGHEGHITEINILTTILRTPNGKEISLTNRLVVNGSIENLTRYGRRLVEIVIPIKMKVVFEDLRKGFEDVLRNYHLIMQEIPPNVAIESIKLNHYNVKLSFWVIPNHFLQAQSDIIQAIKDKTDFMAYWFEDPLSLLQENTNFREGEENE